MRRFVVCGIAASLSLGVFAESWQNDEGVIRTWNSGQLLPATYEVEQDASRKTVVLENVQLSEVEVISSQLNANHWPDTKVDVHWWGTALPFNEMRTDNKLVVDLQSVNVNSNASYYSGGRTVSVRLTLVQDGSDICASVSHAAFVDGRNVIGLDLVSKSVKAVYSVGVIDLATPLSTATGYGIDQLTFSVKTPHGRKEYVQTEALAADETLEVGTNVAVTVETTNVFAGVSSIANPIVLAPGAELTFVDLADRTEVKPEAVGNAATLTFHRTDADAARDTSVRPVVETDPEAINIRCIPNTLLLSVTNVLVAEGKMVVSNQGWVSHVEVWHFKNDGETASFQAQYKQGNDLRCVMVSMRQDGDDIVLGGFGAWGKSNTDFGYKFVGSKDAGEAQFNGYDPETALTKNHLAIRGVTLLCDQGVVDTGRDAIGVTTIYNTNLSSVTNVLGRWGKKIAPNGGWESDTHVYFFVNNGKTVTFQIQWLQGENVLRGQKFTLTQVEENIRVDHSSLHGTAALGTDLTGMTPANTVTSESAHGLAVKGLVLFCDTPQSKPLPDVSLTAGAIGITNGTVKIDGLLRVSITNTAPVDAVQYKTTFVPLLPPGGWFELSNGAQLVIKDWGEYGQGSYKQNRCGFRVGAGSLVMLAECNWPLDDFFPFVLDGGELRLGGYFPTASRGINHLMNCVTFLNGARLTGEKPFMCSLHDAKWVVGGASPSACEAGIRLSSRFYGGKIESHWLYLDVQKTGGGDVDFTLKGEVSPQGEYAQYCGIWKRQSGTAKLAAQNTYTGPTKVTGGTLLLGVSQCIPQTNEVTVAGGALAFAAGTATTFDKVAFGAGTNTLEIAKGATVTFGEMTFGDDVLAINVAGEDASTCVFPRMPARIRRSGLLLNGERAMQDAEGHVVPYEPQGAVIILR